MTTRSDKKNEENKDKLLIVNENYKFKKDLEALTNNDKTPESDCESKVVNENSEESEKNKESTALDGGWGWAVVGGIFVNLVLIQFLGPSYGLLFNNLLVSLNASSSVIHWIFAIQMFIWHVMVLVNGTLIQEFGWRIVGMLGSLLLGIAFVSSAFVTSSSHLFITYSLLTGIGGSMIMTSSFFILPIYWEKRRGLATAIAMAGVCLGQFITPTFINFLLEELGFIGCCIVIGAIVLNGIPASSLFHPLAWHNKYIKKNTKKKSVDKQSSWANHIKDLILRIFKTGKSHLSVLKNPEAILLSLSTSLIMTSIFNFLMNIPYSMMSDGYLLSDAAYGKTIVAAVSAVGRITVAVMSDFSWFRKPLGFLIGIFCSLSTIIGFGFCSDLSSIYAVLAVQGLGLGIIMGLYSLVIIDYMGVEKYPPTFGSACLFTAVASVTVGPLAGLVKDKTGSYRKTLWLLASFETIAVILWLILMIKFKTKKKT